MFSYFSHIFFNLRYLNIFVFLTYFICSIIILRVILPLDGTIGFFHDWPFGPFPEMTQSYGQSGSYIWNSQQGKSLYPTDWILKEFISIFSIIYLNGETLTKGMLIFLITFSGYGAFFLSRKLGLGYIPSFLTGFIYIFTPVMFTRIVAGFIYYLISYMLTPFIIAYFIQGSRVQNISSSRIGANSRKYINFLIAGLLFVFSVQIQFYILVPILLVIIWLIVFRNKQSFIGIVIILSIAFMITIFPFFISSGISKISFDQRQLFDPEFLLNSYSEILKSPNFYEAFRLLGYTTHPYSYTNLGTLNDPLFFETLSTRIINHEYPNLLSRIEFIDSDSNQTISEKSFHLYAQWINSTEKCNEFAFSCKVLDKNNTGIIEKIDIISNNLIVDSLSNKILKVSTIENNDIGANIISKEIPVQYQNYVIMTNLKTNNYSINSQIVLEGFNETSGTWQQIIQCPSGLDGQSPWTRYMCYFSPSSSLSASDQSISKIRLVLHAGWSSEQGKEAITYFGDMYVTPVQDNSLIIPDWIFDLNIVIPVIGFSSLMLYKKNKFVIAFAFISLVGLFLLKGTNPPFSNIFEFLFIKGLYIFREIWHLAFLYCFGITFLIGFFIDKVISYRNIFSTKIINNISILNLKNLVNKISNKYFRIGISVFLTAIIITSNGYPLLIGTFGGYLQTYSFPEEYHDLYNQYTTNQNYNILILPLFGPIQYDDLNISGIDPLLTYSSNNIFYSFPFSSSNTLTSWASLWLHSIMLENNTTNFGSILSGFGIKYIILREDFSSYFPDYIMLGTYQPFRDKWYLSLEPFLDSQKDLAIVENNSNFKIYENTKYASKFFVPQIDLPQFSSYDDLLKLSDALPLNNVITYPINSKNYVNKSNNIHETNYIDFIDIGKYTVSNNPLEWTTNKIWFGYDYLLGSRYHTGAFVIGNTVNESIILNDEKTLPTIDFDLPLENYKNKHIQIWLKALEWPEGGHVEVDIYDKNNKNNSFLSSPDLYSDVPIFSLVKVFDGFIDENKTNDYGFKVSNLHGNNYIEGLYILDVDALTGNKTQNDTSINQYTLNLAINKHAEYISPPDFLMNNNSSSSNKIFFNNHINQDSKYGLNLILNPDFSKLISNINTKNLVNTNNSSYNMDMYKNVLSGSGFNASINYGSDQNLQSFPLGWNDYSNNCNSESGSFICKVIKQSFDSKEIDRNTSGSYESTPESIFQVFTNTTVSNSWSHIGSNEVSVSGGQSYSILGSLRLNDFVKQSHIVIEGFNDELNVWFTLTQCPPGVNGPLNWTTFICTVDIQEPISKIRLVLNAGWTSQPGKQAITNFANVGLFRIDKKTVYEADFNNIIPYNYLNNISSIVQNENISNTRSENLSLVPIEPKSALNVFNFSKVDPTLWKVTVNKSFTKQDDPWTLAFAEAFDPLWQAQVYINGSLLQISDSKPLYGSINGFEINLANRSDTAEGNIDIIIRYLPQELFEVGMKISFAVLFLLLVFLLFITILYRKKRTAR